MNDSSQGTSDVLVTQIPVVRENNNPFPTNVYRFPNSSAGNDSASEDGVTHFEATTHAEALEKHRASDLDRLIAVAATEDVSEEIHDDAKDDHYSHLVERFGASVVELVDLSIGAGTIPDGSLADKVPQIITRISAYAPDSGPTNLILDVTRGLPFAQLILFVTLSHMDAASDDIHLREVRRAEGLGDDKKGDFESGDATQLKDLLDWTYAIRSFRDTGVFRPIADEAKQLDNINDERAQDFDDVATYIDGLAPLEASGPAHKVTAALAADRASGDRTLVNIASDRLSDQLDLFTMGDPGLDSNDRNKDKLRISKAEIDRENKLIRFYTDNDQYKKALRLAREVFLNRIFLESRDSLRSSWLESDQRERMAMVLDREASDFEGGPEQAISDNSEGREHLLRLWSDIVEALEKYNRGGFEEEHFDQKISEDNIQECLRELGQSLDDFSGEAPGWSELKNPI